MAIGDALKALRRKIAAMADGADSAAAPGLDTPGTGLGIGVRWDAASAGWPRELLHPDDGEPKDH